MPDLVLQDPTGIAPGSEIRSLLAEVDHVRGEIADLGEFSPEVQEELRKSFLPERIADTLTIEGINVNPRVTRSILEGLALADSDRYAEQGVLNIVEANDFVESLVTSDAPLDDHRGGD